MIDELLDSLVLNQPRNRVELRAELEELCKGATDLEPILHSFQDKELLRIGVRDILNKDRIDETTAALSDLAETILLQLVRSTEVSLTKRYGVPTVEATGTPCRFVLLALGKLGAREMNYHSDLDLITVYEGDGRSATAEWTDNFQFFTELAQKLIRALSHIGPLGRLYQVDMRLRPTGRSGSLVLPLGEFRRYFGSQPEGGAQLWERQALTRARVVCGEPEFAQQVTQAVGEAIFGRPWQPAFVEEIAGMRERLEASRPARDLKRGPGGLADVEFLVQMLQMKDGGSEPSIRSPNTWQALSAMREVGILEGEEFEVLKSGYDFLLRVQSRLRIVHNRTLDAVPDSAEEVEKLARRLGFTSGASFRAELDACRSATRDLYVNRIARERGR